MRKRYEYKTIDGERLSDEELNQLGFECWTIVHMYSYEYHENTYWNYTLMREKVG